MNLLHTLSPVTDRCPPAPFKVGNRLPEHPFFTDARVRELLSRLPAAAVEIREPRTVATETGTFQRRERITHLSPVEAFDRLAQAPTWINIHNAHRFDPELNAIMRGMVNEFSTQIREMGRGMDDLSDVGAFLILSSGGGVVHFHSDPDQSFLSQIRGSKTLYTYPAAMLEASLIERLLATEDHGAVTYKPEYEASMFKPARLTPGESCFIPLCAPHRVTNDAEISWSLSIGFNTKASLRRKQTHLMNAKLRRLGVTPASVGRSRWSDESKASIHSAFVEAKHLLKGAARTEGRAYGA